MLMDGRRTSSQNGVEEWAAEGGARIIFLFHPRKSHLSFHSVDCARGNKRKCQGGRIMGWLDGWKGNREEKSYLRFMSRIITVNCHSNSRPSSAASWLDVAVCLSPVVDPFSILLWVDSIQAVARLLLLRTTHKQMKRLLGWGIKHWHRSLITWKHLLILLTALTTNNKVGTYLSYETYICMYDCIVQWLFFYSLLAQRKENRGKTKVNYVCTIG